MILITEMISIKKQMENTYKVAHTIDVISTFCVIAK